MVRTRVPLFVVILIAVSCGRQPLDLGSQIDGTWVGTITNFSFPGSGSNTIVLHLALTTDGSVAGTMVLGTGMPPPAAMNGTVGYPPGLTWMAALSHDQQLQLYEGVPFTFVEGSLEGSHLRLGISTHDLWLDWCNLQMSYPFAAPETFECVPAKFFLTPPRCSAIGWPSTDCTAMALCVSGVCTCNASGCGTAAGPGPVTVPLDGQFDGQHIDGHIGLLLLGQKEVHLVRF